MDHFIRCIECGNTYPPDEALYICPNCGDLLEVVYDYQRLTAKVAESDWKHRPISVWKYKEVLPIEPSSYIVSLGEGNTGLHLCPRLARAIGLKELWVKNEGENPTGSFKDRGMTVAISKAVELKSKVVACASTGNTAASLAAYAARAGIRSLVLVPSGKVAVGKLAQAIACGARVIQMKGNFDEALKAILQLTVKSSDFYLLNSVNPYRIEGQKTLAFEIFDQLKGMLPESVILPVGNAGNISSIWKGFLELRSIGLAYDLPRMIGIQAQGAAPLVKAFCKGSDRVEFIPNPESEATAIRIGSPANWKRALRAVRDSKGIFEAVRDQEILDAQKLIARLEGIFIEPASAAPIAALKKLVEEGAIGYDERIVSIATGHGLKDPDIVTRTCETLREVECSPEAILKAMGD
jgi:threonine synthase